MKIGRNSVTWLMPVKDGMPYLPETLKSIECQSISGHQLYVWENGSSDCTLKVLNDWIPRRIPGRVFSDEPLSYSASLARLVREADTELCARIDADDVNHPRRLEAQLSFMKSNPDVVAVGGQVNRLGADGHNYGAYYELPAKHEDIVVRMLRLWGMWHPTVVFRRSAVLSVGNYYDERPVEDYSLWLRLARVGKLANLDDVVLDYRVHDKSVTQTASAEGSLHDAICNCVVLHGAELFGIRPERLSQIVRGQRLTTIETIECFRCLMRHHCNPVALAMTLYKKEFKGIGRVMRDLLSSARIWRR